MATTELKLAQDLVRVNQCPLFLVFLDLRKAYGILNRGRLIRTLEEYGAGPRMCKIVATFWDHQEVFKI